ncbi:hypothetical protein, partial [Microcella frigidaquae]
VAPRPTTPLARLPATVHFSSVGTVQNSSVVDTAALTTTLATVALVVGLGATPAYAAKVFINAYYCLSGVGHTSASSNLVTNHVKQQYATSANQVRTYWILLLPETKVTRWTNNSSAVSAYVDNGPGAVSNARWFCG